MTLTLCGHRLLFASTYHALFPANTFSLTSFPLNPDLILPACTNSIARGEGKGKAGTGGFVPWLHVDAAVSARVLQARGLVCDCKQLVDPTSKYMFL